MSMLESRVHYGIWNEELEGNGVSRALLYLEYLNTRNTFTKKLNDKEEKDNRLKMDCPARYRQRIRKTSGKPISAENKVTLVKAPEASITDLYYLIFNFFGF
jgi:hypothetical protein